MKPYYKICPTCGCTLDPGERCEDCHPREIVYPNAKGYKSVEDIMRKVVKRDVNYKTNKSETHFQ
jgi:hypothetical protein